jgi:hypothetical protein
MDFLPFTRMWQRIDVDRQDSDTTLGLSLLYFGEMIIKTIGVGLIAAIQDDRERNRYRQMYRLVRSDGVGEWVSTIEDILTGPTLQSLRGPAKDERAQLFDRVTSGWQFDSAILMHDCIELIEPRSEKLQAKLDARRWLSDFAKLRNATRGHGAAYSEMYGKICVPLEKSLRIFSDNFRLFQRPWAFLYRNLSGKYRVTKLSLPSIEFDEYKKGQFSHPVPSDGVYVWFDQPARVDLMYSSVDAVDFWYPNGKFSEKKFETISYITSSKCDEDSTPYLKPSTPLPSSETEGFKNLEIQGNSFGNLPPKQNGYIQRHALENELKQALLNDRHPVITLVGRGGIGKTWLTLNVLYDIANLSRFTAILWFSARDIDLLPEGPKTVTPHVLTTPEIAQEVVKLLEPTGYKEKGFDSVRFLSQTMTRSHHGPILFVFDNFETVRAPIELFNWIDTYVRLPNKVLITTRFREFKGDYPIEVLGMNEAESEELILTTSQNLGITHLLTESYKSELFLESNGHPYVMKVLLGEVANAGKIVRVERIVAAREDILDALFERTFSGLSPVAKRVFLTTCSWRSSIPLLALEAVLLRPANERMDVESAVEELSRSSFVELTTSKEDNELFVTVPLAASVFGKKKLSTYSMKIAVESDLQLLHAFGAAQQSDINRGVGPRIEKLYGFIAERISLSQTTIEESLPILEFVARKFPRAWLLLAKLYQEIDSRNVDKAKECVRRYIETSPQDKSELSAAWGYLAQLCSQTGDWTGEIQALVEMSQLPDIPFYEISNSVNRVNLLFNQQFYVLDSEEKKIISRKLAEVMEGRIFDEGDATDCSRLAWLLIRLRDKYKAKQITDYGLSVEPDNEYCKKLLVQLNS